MQLLFFDRHTICLTLYFENCALSGCTQISRQSLRLLVMPRANRTCVLSRACIARQRVQACGCPFIFHAQTVAHEVGQKLSLWLLRVRIGNSLTGRFPSRRRLSVLAPSRFPAPVHIHLLSNEVCKRQNILPHGCCVECSEILLLQRVREFCS